MLKPTLIIRIVVVGIALCALTPVPGAVTGATVSPSALVPTAVTISGRQLLVEGVPFTVKGVGYAPTPIGESPDDPPYGDYFTQEYRAIWERDLPLLREMGANTIRIWGWKHDADHSAFLDAAYNDGDQPIYVICGYWIDKTARIWDPAVRQILVAEFVEMVQMHKDHPAVLMWAIGNELNASWMFGNVDALYTLIEEMAQAAHQAEGANYHPVTVPLADENLVATLAERGPQVPTLDVWSVQVYRGDSFGTLFTDYKAVSAKPLVITEFGIDAYDDRFGDEYEALGPPYQAIYARSLWEEVVANADVCSGATLMEYSDEWWKGCYTGGDPDRGCPECDPSYHGTCGYLSTAHPDGYANEEWWGIMRVVDNGDGPDIVQPRRAYDELRSLWIAESEVYLPLVMCK